MLHSYPFKIIVFLTEMHGEKGRLVVSFGLSPEM